MVKQLTQESGVSKWSSFSNSGHLPPHLGICSHTTISPGVRLDQLIPEASYSSQIP